MNISDEYWKKTYTNLKGDSEVVTHNSTFSEFCLNYIPKGPGFLVDLGCGNGRDSIYFSKMGHDILMIDKSQEALNLISSDFVTLQIDFEDINNVSIKERVKCFYSRFSLHSLKQETQHNLLNWIFKNLEPSGYLMIETRSKKDSKFGIGTKVDENSFIGTHYRRFQSMEELTKELTDIGFSVIVSKESTVKGNSKSEDAEVLRIILKK